ncbi:hypothetical protein BY458DRAFT_439620, partial [Sporodiniella umbellata]
GNTDCHTILRGSSSGPNYTKTHVENTRLAMEKAGVRANVMIDCSHGNSLKDHRNQPKVCLDLGKQIAAGDDALVGVMIESNICEGKQALTDKNHNDLKYGVSITDACVDFETTEKMLFYLGEAVKARRSIRN